MLIMRWSLWACGGASLAAGDIPPADDMMLDGDQDIGGAKDHCPTQPAADTPPIGDDRVLNTDHDAGNVMACRGPPSNSASGR